MQYRFRAARDELKYHATPVDPATTAGHPTRFRDAIYIACRVERENAKSVSAIGGRQSYRAWSRFPEEYPPRHFFRCKTWCR